MRQEYCPLMKKRWFPVQQLEIIELKSEKAKRKEALFLFLITTILKVGTPSFLILQEFTLQLL